MPDSQIGQSDWKVSQDRVFMVCEGEADQVWLIEINFYWSNNSNQLNDLCDWLVILIRNKHGWIGIKWIIR